MRHLLTTVLAINCLWASCLRAETYPLWENLGKSPVTVVAVDEQSIPVQSGKTADTQSSSVPQSVSVEITQLARALDNDPVAIFNYVRNEIHYEPYHGLRKGAVLTMLEGSGNSFDQCALLGDLLVAAGHSEIKYRLRGHIIDYDKLVKWLGLADEPYPGKSYFEAFGEQITETYPDNTDRGVGDYVAKQASFGARYLSTHAMRYAEVGAAVWYPSFPQKASLVFERMFVELKIDGHPYLLDPSYKTYEEIEGVNDLLTATGYNRDSFISASNGIDAAWSTKDLDNSAVQSRLSSLSGQLLAYLRANYPGIGVDELVRGRRILKREISSLDEAMELPQSFQGIDQSWATLSAMPLDHKSIVRFTSGGLNYSIPTSELEGRKLSLTFNNSTAQLRLDDGNPVATTIVSDNAMDLKIEVTHPGLQPYSETKSYKKNGSYAILYGFAPSGKLLQKRAEQLLAHKDGGMSDSSRVVRTEILNIMGLNWLYQTHLVQGILARMNRCSNVYFHRFGRMSQEDGFYIDVGLQLSVVYPKNGNFDDGGYSAVFHFGALMASAMEHGVIEQMQPNASAISTVNLLRKANQDGIRLYLADITNWGGDSGIRSQLVNYSKQRKDLLSGYINDLENPGKLLLSKNGSINQGIWTGAGWIVYAPESAGMLINGGFSGGYSTSYGTVSSPRIDLQNTYNPTYTHFPSSSSTVRNATVPSIRTPAFYGSDPVDMATGAFTYAAVDMNVGLDPAPRGLSFSRHYSSKHASRRTQNLGYGWSHGLHIRAQNRTAVEESLGLGTIQQLTPMLTGLLVGSDLYRPDARAIEWGLAVLTAGWAVDRMTDNAVSVTMGHHQLQFLEMPDGSYQPPAGSTMTLENINGTYHLKQRHGNTIVFEPASNTSEASLRAARIVDPYGRQMTFRYYSNDRINYVEDAAGRRFTFGWTNNYITSVTDSSGGRTVYYGYDPEGNLDVFTDAENKQSYYDYEVPGDPAGITADKHLLVRMRNHDSETITQNVYDPLERVGVQWLHGDSDKAWVLNYAGSHSTEENPQGDVTTYFYDNRRRATGKRDASGKLETWEYDGQDRIVRKTSGEGEATMMHYDADHNLVQVDHPRGGGSTRYEYDELNRIDIITDAENNVTDYVYSNTGVHADKNAPRQIIDPEGVTTITYKDSGAAAGKVWKVTDNDGLTTEHGYDTHGQPDWVKSPGGFLTDFTYTVTGNLQSVVNPNGILTEYAYNNRRQPTLVIEDKNGADEATTDITYNGQGLPDIVSGPADRSGQRIITRTTYNATEKKRFQYLGNDAGGEDTVSESRYDSRDWLEYSYDALNRETHTDYYANGEVAEVTQPGNRALTYLSDNDYRPTAVTTPGSNLGDRTTRTTYGVTDAAGGDVTTGFPKTTVVHADGRTTISEHNRLGQLRYYRDRAGNVFEFRYDGLGRQVALTNPLDASQNVTTISTTYTHRGAPLVVREASGESATHTYDPITGRLQSIAYSGGGGGTVSYSGYDNNGNATTITEGAQTISRSYDRLDRVASHTDVAGKELGYRYHADGRLWKLIYPGGSENGTGHVEYTYWKTGRLKSVIDKLDSTSEPRSTNYYWNADGKLRRIERPNGTKRVIDYDDEGRPVAVSELSSTGALLHISRHGYYASNEIEWSEEAPRPPQQKVRAIRPIANATYDTDNSLVAFNGNSVEHDADGNLTRGPLPDGTAGSSFVYNSRNWLTSAGGVSYNYDPQGTRVSTSEAGGTSYVTDVNSGLSRVLSRTRNGETTRYVYGLGLLYEVDGNGQTTTYHYNSSGSTVALSNESQLVVERMGYSLYGQVTYRESLDGDDDLHDTPFLFTGFFGNQTDSNGLVHMRARYYNPLLRRFMNPDPAREGWNWYAYAAGNPLSYVDPSGLGAESILDAVQTGLSYLGMVPAIGIFADLVNAGVSVARGNYAEAAIDIAAATPGAGLAVGAAAIAARSTRIVKNISRSGGLRAPRGTATPFYRYVGEGEAAAIRRTGQIPNVDQFGNPKTVYFTERFYETAGRAKTFNQLPSKPTYRIEIVPANVQNRSPFTRIEPSANPQWGRGGGVEATTLDPIPVDPSTLTRLRGAP